MHAYSLNLRGTLLPLDRPRLMAVVNCTPDSFYAGGRNGSVDQAIRAWDAGADLVDVGGQSTRPGAEPVGAAEEGRRLQPVLEGLLAARPEARVSVDTYRAEVARRGAVECKGREIWVGVECLQDLVHRAHQGMAIAFEAQVPSTVPVCMGHHQS